MSFIVSHDVDGHQIALSDAEAVVLLVVGGGVDTTTSLDVVGALCTWAGIPNCGPVFSTTPRFWIPAPRSSSGCIRRPVPTRA